MRDEELDYTVEEYDRHRVVSLNGKLVLYNVEQFREEFLKLLEQDRKAVHFNLKDLAFIDSSGMGLLITLNRKMQAAEREIIIRNPQEAIRKIFQVSGLDKVFQIKND